MTAPLGERKLRNRKRRANKGRVLRVSRLFYETVDVQRRGRSWDTLLRSRFGLPDRDGREQPLLEGMLEVTSGVFILKMPDTTWGELEQVVYRLAERVARKQGTRPEVPMRMREVRT